MTARILVVDDLEQNIKLLEAKLLTGYYIVFTASSGKAAIELLEKEKIDVILLDGMMPDMDGFETCKLIKSNPKTTHIPVVMITALSDISDRIHGLEVGADEFLTKPVDDVALFARVNSLSRTKAVIDELKLRNKTNATLGGKVVELIDSFADNNIVIIDDDVVQAKNIVTMLNKITSNTHILRDIEGITKMAFDIDLIIISCQMESDPLRILSSLRGMDILKNTAFTFLADEDSMKIVIKGLELGINDYFIYPVDQNELLARIRTQLRRKKYQDELRNELDQSLNLSFKDSLTGIYNRRYFDAHIEHLISDSKNLNSNICLLMVDIDHFKKVNDKYGHQAGDFVLKAVTEALSQSIREIDLLARYGGEEFVIVFSNVPISQGLKLAERLRKSVEELNITLPEINESISCTISIGITEYKDTDSIAQFIEKADKALYRSKSEGRNRISSDL